MERWDVNVINTNATCRQLGSKSLQLLGMHALSDCDTTSYPLGKGKLGALKVLMSRDCPLYTTLGESTATHIQLMDVGRQFFTALYGQKPDTSMASAWCNLYICKKVETPQSDVSSTYCSNPITSYSQLLLWKSADKNAPPACTEHLDQYGWKRGNGGIPSPAYHDGPPALPHLMDVISCRCTAEGRACGAKLCSCHKGRVAYAGVRNVIIRTHRKDMMGWKIKIMMWILMR